MALVPAADGLPARLVSGWNDEKLYYISRYLDIFCTGMSGKWTLVYADLLSGPGWCVTAPDAVGVPGSAGLAIAHRQFSRLFLNDIDPVATEALATLNACQLPSRLRISTDDCNHTASAAHDFLFPRSEAGSTLGLAVLDPTGFQISYDSIARLSRGVRLDLIVIVMTGYMKRFIEQPEMEASLDRFFGTARWRALVDQRVRGEHLTFAQLIKLYEDQLRTIGYNHFNSQLRIDNSNNAPIYHIVYASKHARGADFFDKISQIR